MDKFILTGQKICLVSGFVKISWCIVLLSICGARSGITHTVTGNDSRDTAAFSFDSSAQSETIPYHVLKDLPLRSLSSLYLTIPLSYSNGNSYYINSIGLMESNTVIDGVQIRYSNFFPYRAIRQMDDYSMFAPIEFGNSLNLIAVQTERSLKQWYVSVETAADFRFYYMNNPDPVASGKRPLNFYPYGNDLVAMDAGGPFKIGKHSGTVFFVMNLNKLSEQYPSWVNNYQINTDVLTSLQEHPLRATGTGAGSFENAEYISAENIEETRFSSNAGLKDINTYFRLDYPLTDNVSVTLGSYMNIGRSRAFIYENSMFNSENNPEVITRNFDNYAKLQHRLLKDERNELSYIAQVSYSNYYTKVQSERHKDDLFMYGYLGKFSTYSKNSYESGTDSATGLAGMIQSGFIDTLYTFEPGGYNPVAENVTSNYYDLYSDPADHYESSNQLLDGGGLINGYMPGEIVSNVYNIWNSPGQVFDLYSIKNEEVLRGKLSFNLAHKKHRFAVGMEFNRQTERSYTANPIALWRQMRILANNHLLQLDKHNPQPVYVDITGTPSPDDDTIYAGIINYPRNYDGTSQSYFDKNLRAKLGIAKDGTDWIDVNSLPLETFSLDMFSADELLNNGNGYVSYYGYDYLGNKLDPSGSGLEYYSAVDDDGNYKRPVRGYQPRAGTAYLNYGFEGKMMRLSLGVRADFFNANQPVLKDKYSFYEIRTVEVVSGALNISGEHPASVQDDFAVYVDNMSNPTRILGYRDGDQWYNDAGQKIPNATPLLTSTGIVPYLLNPATSLADAFENSPTVISILPQVRFEYVFDAGWRVFGSNSSATQNPRVFNVFSPEQYLTILNTNVTVNNPALRPLMVSKVKAGVGQNITDRTTIEFYGSHIEYEQIQVTRIFDAYPRTYDTYDVLNSIVNGLTFSVRHGTVRNAGLYSGVNLNIQFVNPTYGSYLRKIANGYLRFNFGCKDDYLGYTTKSGKQPLQCLGIAVFFHVRDGNRYSKIKDAVPEGLIYTNANATLDGAPDNFKMPPIAFVHLKIEKGVELPKWQMRFDFYAMVQNIFNHKNIIDVYRYTGSPSDDGYLTDPGSQAGISSMNVPDAFRTLYSLKTNDPGNYEAPRVLRFGAVLNF